MELIENQTYLRGLDQLLTNGKNALAVSENYILPEEERPDPSTPSDPLMIPIIDLSLIEGPSKSMTIKNIAKACENYGFFQIINHGVPREIMEKMHDVGKEFFEMPVEDRACLYSEDPFEMVRIATSFNIHKEKVRSWRDSLRHPCYPLDVLWNKGPKKPLAYREIAVAYSKEIRSLEARLLGLLSQALGLEEEHLSNKFGAEHPMVMSLNYYPACPRPDLTIGLQGHSDASGFSILMQDLGGLQVLKDGKWLNVDPIPDAFVVNVGDILEVLSNGRFKSVEYRVLTNLKSARLTIVAFNHLQKGEVIAPMEALIDEEHHPMFRGFKFEEYFESFFGGTLTRKSALEPFKLHPFAL